MRRRGASDDRRELAFWPYVLRCFVTLYASIDSVQITDARIVVPRIGSWFADLTLATEKTITGTHSLTVGDLAWKCTVWRGAAFQGRTRLKVIGGYGGWQTQIPAKQYRVDTGVKLAMVLAEAASACGEQVSVTTDRSVGTFTIRDVGPAQRILNRLATEWHVRADGVTVVGPWATLTAITEKFDLTAFDGAAGRAELATEALSAFTPGRTFTPITGGGTITIGAVTHSLSASKVRSEILAAEVRP